MLLNSTDQSGITYRQHLEQVERQTGSRPADLNGPDFPLAMSHIWSAFLDLSQTRSQGYNGPMPITYTEMKNFCDMTGIDISPFEIKLIKRLDSLYLKEVNK